MRSISTFLLLFIAVLSTSSSPSNAAFAQSGRLIASSSSSGIVTVYDSRSGRIVSQLPKEPHIDDRLLSGPTLDSIDKKGSKAVGNSDGGLSVTTDSGTVQCTSPPDPSPWATETAQHGWIIAHPGRVIDVKFSPNGRWLVSAGGDGTIRLWDPTNGMLNKVITSPNGVQTIIFSSNSQTLFAAFRDKIIEFACPTMRAIKAFDGHDGVVTALTLSSDDNTLWSKSDDMTIKRWDVQRGVNVATYGRIQQSTIDGDGDKLAYSLGDGNVTVVSLNGSKSPVTLHGFVRLKDDAPDTVDERTLAFDTHGNYLAGGDVLIVSLTFDTYHCDPNVMVWDAKTGKLLHDWIGDPSENLAFSKQDHRLVESDFEPYPSHVIVRNFLSGKVVDNCETPDDTLVDGPVTLFGSTAIFEPDGSTLFAYSSSDGGQDSYGLTISSIKPLETVKILSPAGDYQYVCIGAGPYLMATTSNTIELWNYRTGVRVWSRQCLPDAYYMMAAVTKHGTVAKVDMAKYGYFGNYVPSPITVYDSRSGRIVKTLTGMFDGVTSFALIRDEKCIFASSADGDVREWKIGH